MTEKFEPILQPEDNDNQAEQKQPQKDITVQKSEQSGPEKHGQILDRIMKENGTPDLFETLTGMLNSDFQSVLLKIMEEKSSKVGVREINAALEMNAFVKPSPIDQREFLDLDTILYDLLPEEYRSIELSPLVPFAVNNLLADINQKRVFSTMRNVEVISDPTTALALYCGQERAIKVKENPKSSEAVKMATSQRIIRQDPVKKEGYSQHFRLFSIATAGRDTGSKVFEKENLREHLTILLSSLRALNDSNKYDIGDITVDVSDVAEEKHGLIEEIESDILGNLRGVFPEVIFNINRERKSNYYKSLCYSISAKSREHEKPMSVAGGGITDWTEILVGSKKERLLIGSIGSESICRYFKKNQ